MAGIFQSGILRRLHRHRRALAEGAIEQDVFARSRGKTIQ
jgi:hypothetical protein